MKNRIHFSVTIPRNKTVISNCQERIIHTGDITVTGVADNRGGDTSYDVDEVMVNNRYISFQDLETLGFDIDEEIGDAIMAHCCGLFAEDNAEREAQRREEYLLDDLNTKEAA